MKQDYIVHLPKEVKGLFHEAKLLSELAGKSGNGVNSPQNNLKHVTVSSVWPPKDTKHQTGESRC